MHETLRRAHRLRSPPAPLHLREIRRILGPGGRLVVAHVPRDTMGKHGATDHGFTLYESDELVRMMEEADFGDITVASGSDQRGECVCLVGNT